ncbi:MAG TPA: hypothetical protein VL402_02130 [Xanthobacteraceae bacterium]|jgi:hypothetical protein|nr:hypothetical protein [Xanthobacteraceae bacterium]
MQKITVAVIAILATAAFSPASAAPPRARAIQARDQTLLPSTSFDRCRELAVQRGERLFSKGKSYGAFLTQCQQGLIR